MAMTPLPARARLDATCRIESVEPDGDDGALARLRALRPGTFGDRRLSPGAPLTIRFAAGRLTDPSTPSGAVTRRWSEDGTPVRVVVVRKDRGYDFLLTDGRDVVSPAGAEPAAQRAA